MHALLQSVEMAVFAMAAAAFAHFGVSLRAPPCPPSQAVVRKVEVSTVEQPAPGVLRPPVSPCALDRTATQA